MSSAPPILPPFASLDFELAHTSTLADPSAATTQPTAITGLPDFSTWPAARAHQQVNPEHTIDPARHMSSLPEAITFEPPASNQAAYHQADADEDDEEDEDDDDDDTGREHDDNDDYDNEDEHDDAGNNDDGRPAAATARPAREHDPYPWLPLKEDTTLPCDDELAFIQGKEEHSALDYAYWEQQTFIDLDDPELSPSHSGRIEWTIDSFNGTKDKPNRQLVMTSHSVKIGDHDWQIKFYPKGNRTDFLSVYIDCPSLRDPGFVDKRAFKLIPLPRPAGSPIMQQSITLSAQVCVVMYNPAEPRVYEHKIDACQFSKSDSDFGWRFFTREPRQNFHHRKHGQRESILKNDKLAFVAYIRLVNDPTACLWRRSPCSVEASISTTSLRPIDGMSAQGAAALMLLHLNVFRGVVVHTAAKSSVVIGLRQILTRFLHRRMRRKHLKAYGMPDRGDVVEVLLKLHSIMGDLADGASHDYCAKFMRGLVHPGQHVGANRLKTGAHSSVQSALDELNIVTTPATPFILPLELERQRFDSSTRSWMQVNNEVRLNDRIQYANRRYSLYGYVIHKGALGSGQYYPVIRPGGPSTPWYLYDNTTVTCLTQKAAHLRAVGIDPTARPAASKQDVAKPKAEVPEKELAYMAWYIREDHESKVYRSSAEEKCPSNDAMSSPSTKVAAKDDSQPQQSPEQTHAKQPAIAMEPVRLRSLRGVTRRDLSAQSANLMDGEDVIMSDSEEDHTHQSLLSQAILSPTQPSIDTTPSQELAKPPKVTRKTFAFHSGEYYSGDVLPDNTYHGQGCLIRTNGDAYQGHFMNGQPHGKGIMKYGKTGDEYDGEWLDGQHHGQGKFSETQTGNVYEGGWKEGRRHGAFVMRGTVTEDDKNYCQICYINTIDTALYNCGHALTCKHCAHAITQCPVCRREIIYRLELFGVKISMQ